MRTIEQIAKELREAKEEERQASMRTNRLLEELKSIRETADKVLEEITGP